MHKELPEKRSAEVLDVLIGAALRGSVAGAEPSPRVWERIKERLEGRTLAKQASFWQNFCMIFGNTLDWLGGESVLTPAQPAYYNQAQSGRAVREENYLCSLAYQCELLMQLARAC
jgi:hypothetical protein